MTTDLNAQLRDAALNGHRSRIRELCAQGANPNAPDSQGRTSLHYACGLDTTIHWGSLLHSVNISPVATDRLGVFYSDRARAVGVLLRRGGNPGLRDQDGVSANRLARACPFASVRRELAAHV